MLNKNFTIGLILAPIIYVAYNLAESKLEEPKQQKIVKEQLNLTDINFIPSRKETYAPSDNLLELSKKDKNFKKEINLSEFKGKPTIVHVWAPWCGACTGEMVEFDDFAKKCAGKVNVMAIGLDQEKGSGLREFYNNHNISNLKIYYDSTGKLSRNLKAHGLPTTIFLNSDGMEVGRVIGPIDWSKYQNLIKKKLGV